MSDQENKIIYFAKTDSRGEEVKFGIKNSDRTRHIYVIGKTGMGKSTLIENMAIQDVLEGNGLCFIDPHGSAIETILEYIPEERVEDVIYVAPFDTENPISFNVMEDVGPERRHLVAQGLLSAFKKIWGEDTFSDRMEHITSNCLLALLEYPGSTILGITRILTDNDFRKEVVSHIKDPSVRSFWVNEYGKWDERYRKEAGAAILNKVGQFTSNPLIRNIVGQEKSSFDFRKLMDEKKILLVNLSIGQVGEQNANLLGAMITTKIFLGAASRADVSKDVLEKLPNFYLYIDEFQNLANDSFAGILAQSRKYKLSLILAHQYIEQMPESVKDAVFGNVGTMIVFRIGSADAEIFEQEFSPEFTSEDLVNLGFTQIYLKLMIDGIGSRPFSATTLPPMVKPEISFKDEAIVSSRRIFAKKKEEVSEKIDGWLNKKFGSGDDKKNNAPHHQNHQKKDYSKNKKPWQKPKPKPEIKNFSKEDEKELGGKNSLKEALAGILEKDNKEEKFENKKTEKKFQKTNNFKKDTKKPEEKNFQENSSQKENSDFSEKNKAEIKEPEIKNKDNDKKIFGMDNKQRENLKDFLRDVE